VCGLGTQSTRQADYICRTHGAMCLVWWIGLVWWTQLCHEASGVLPEANHAWMPTGKPYSVHCGNAGACWRRRLLARLKDSTLYKYRKICYGIHFYSTFNGYDKRKCFSRLLWLSRYSSSENENAKSFFYSKANKKLIGLKIFLISINRRVNKALFVCLSIHMFAYRFKEK